jgi:hypothetical protein
MATDRDIIKTQQIGMAQTAPDIVTPKAAVRAIHTRSRDFPKVGTENAATNVAETCMFTVRRASKPAGVYFTGGGSVAGNATDYAYLTVEKMTAGVASGIVASYNTHTSAQSSITGNVAASFSLNADCAIAVGDTLTYKIRKVSATGALITIGCFTVDLEEV